MLDKKWGRYADLLRIGEAKVTSGKFVSMGIVDLLLFGGFLCFGA
jgi:hypothetical protein